MTATQCQLFSLTAENFDAPLSDWVWENNHIPVQERSISQMRSIYVNRSHDDRPKALSLVPDRCDRSDVLGTVGQQSPKADKNVLGTVGQQSPKVHKHALPNMYREFINGDYYWRMKPYINGKRKTIHLHKNYGEAITIGRKILVDLGKAA